MSSPKTIQRYNSMWFDLFDRFLEDEHQVIEVPARSEQSAKALRLEFYKVRGVILGTDDKKPADAEMARMYREVLNSREVKVQERDGTWFCIFDHRDHNWVGQLLQKAVPRKREKQHER